MPVIKIPTQICPARKSDVENDSYPNTMREMTLAKATNKDANKTDVTIPSIRKSAAGSIKFSGTSAVGILLECFVDNSLISNSTILYCAFARCNVPVQPAGWALYALNTAPLLAFL